MNKRHSGWIGHRLKKQITHLAEDADVKLTKFTGLKSISGLETRIIRVLTAVCELHKAAKLGSDPRENAVIGANPAAFVRPLLPTGYNAYLVKNLYIVKLLIARSYRALRMAKRRPVHGQRRWSNAKMAKICSGFLWRSVKAYETDIYRFKTRRHFRWSKQWEMRQQAKMRKKTKKKKWTKFKRFGERRLAIKKKKKTPWD